MINPKDPVKGEITPGTLLVTNFKACRIHLRENKEIINALIEEETDANSISRLNLCLYHTTQLMLNIDSILAAFEIVRSQPGGDTV